jgi:hypothetical protein
MTEVNDPGAPGNPLGHNFFLLSTVLGKQGVCSLSNTNLHILHLFCFIKYHSFIRCRIEFSIGCDVTQEFKKAVNEAEEWHPLIDKRGRSITGEWTKVSFVPNKSATTLLLGHAGDQGMGKAVDSGSCLTSRTCCVIHQQGRNKLLS